MKHRFNSARQLLQLIGFTAACYWWLLGGAVAQDGNVDVKIRFDCRLLEMTPQQADFAQRALSLGKGLAPLQAQQLNQLLWGSGCKKLAELSVTTASGVQGEAEAGGKPIQRTDKIEEQGTRLNITPELSPQATLCQATVVFDKRELRLNDTEEINFTGNFHSINGGTALLVRRDFGGKTTLLIIRTTWAAPASKPQPNSDMPALQHLRAQVFTVTPFIAREAAQLKDNPTALAALLEKKTVPTASVMIAAGDSQSQLSSQIRRSELKKGFISERIVSGTVLTATVTTKPDGGKSLNALVQFNNLPCPQIMPGRPAEEQDISATANDVNVPNGSAVAVACVRNPRRFDDRPQSMTADGMYTVFRLFSSPVGLPGTAAR
jgi:hypothetical protein